MSARILRLGQLSQRERSVLMLMRRGPVSNDPAMATAFSMLSRDARRAGLVVSAPAHSIVHYDEKKLLAWLTLLQRQKTDLGMAWDMDLDEELLASLRTCARLLDEAALRLDYRNAVRFLHGVQARHEWGEPADPTYACIPFGSLLQRRALRLVAEKGVVATHDLNAAGVSSHIIRTLRKRGMLRRIRHGLYALGQPDRALATGRRNAGHALHA